MTKTRTRTRLHKPSIFNNKRRLKLLDSRYVYWNLIIEQRVLKTKLLFQTTGLNSCLNKKQRKINQFRSNLIYLLKASEFVGTVTMPERTNLAWN